MGSATLRAEVGTEWAVSAERVAGISRCWAETVAAVAVAIPSWMLIAGAMVTNPGNVKVGMTTTIHAADFDLDAMKLSAPADATLDEQRRA